MRKILTSALAAITFGGAVLATAAPAEAQRYRHDYYRGHHHSGNTAATAAIAGIAGLALGSALASNGSSRGRVYSSGYGYDPRYDSYSGDYYGSGRPYAYVEPRYRTCISRERVWDPYIQRRVVIERSYPC